MKYFDDTNSPTSIPVRAILATLFTVTVCVGFYMGKLSSEAFITLAGMAIGWYFAKVHQGNTDNPNDDGDEDGDNGNGVGTVLNKNSNVSLHGVIQPQPQPDPVKTQSSE